LDRRQGHVNPQVLRRVDAELVASGNLDVLVNQGPAEDRDLRSLDLTRLITADETAAALGEPVGPPVLIAVGTSTTSCLWRPTSGRRSSLTVTVATEL
jgi:hypothetical protein